MGLCLYVKGQKQVYVPVNHVNPETLERVKHLQNIKRAYYNIGNEENSKDKMILVENFINEVAFVQDQKSMGNKCLSRINSRYSDYLYELSSIYNDFGYNTEIKNNVGMNINTRLMMY